MTSASGQGDLDRQDKSLGPRGLGGDLDSEAASRKQFGCHLDVQDAIWRPFGRPGRDLDAFWTSRKPFGGHVDVQDAIWRPFGRP